MKDQKRLTTGHTGGTGNTWIKNPVCPVSPVVHLG